MKQLKKISCFGTSHTAGGGFEFESLTGFPYDKSERLYGEVLKEVYKEFPNPKTQFRYSWPGQLQELLLKNNLEVEVLNRAKQGYGNERVYRKVFETIDDPSFDKDTHLLLIEFSFIGRKEYFWNEFNDYIICNYSPEEAKDFKGNVFPITSDVKNKKKKYIDMVGPINDTIGYAHSWFYDDNSNICEILDERIPKIINPFVSKSLDWIEQYKQLRKNITFFLSYLLFNKINFLISFAEFDNSVLELDENIFNEIKKRKIYYGDTESWPELMERYKLTISNETNGVVDDRHFGFYGNKLVSEYVFNHLSKMFGWNPIPIKIQEYIDKTKSIF